MFTFSIMDKCCEFCGKETNSSNLLILTNEAVKFKEKDFSLQNCLNIFKDELVQHFLSANEVKICQKCMEQLVHTLQFIQQMRATQKQKMTFQEQDQQQKYRKILPKFVENHTVPCNTVAKVRQTQRVYNCSECVEVFKSFRQLKAHETLLHSTSSSADNISICTYCCSLYANEETLEKHITGSHADGQYMCRPCKKNYKSKGYLSKHAARKHHSNNLLYYCTLCPPTDEPLQFTSRVELQKHFHTLHLMPTSQEEDDVEIEMKEEFLDEFLSCNTDEILRQLSAWDALDLHLPDMLHLHSDNNQQDTDDSLNKTAAAYKCPKCCEDCTNQKTLLIHLAQKHNMNVLICNKCDISFHDVAQFARHKANHYLQDNMYATSAHNQCGICDKSFNSSAALNYHIKTHARTSSTALAHKCPYCSKCFHTALNIKQHLRIVHSQLKPHVCQLCDKQFATLDHLKKHVLSLHQNERKHICHVCDKRFKQLCHLKQHVAIHTNGKTFKCNLCSSMYWKKIDLERHTINKHDP